MYNTKSTDWFREGVKKNRFKTALLDVAHETYFHQIINLGATSTRNL